MRRLLPLLLLPLLMNPAVPVIWYMAVIVRSSK